MIGEDVKYFSNHSSTFDRFRWSCSLHSYPRIGSSFLSLLLLLLSLLPCDSSCARSIEERKCLRSLAQDTESRFYRFLSPFSRTSRVEQCYYNGVKRDGQQQRVTGSSSVIPPFELLELYDLGGCIDTRNKLTVTEKKGNWIEFFQLLILYPTNNTQYFQTVPWSIIKLKFNDSLFPFFFRI